LCGVSIQALNDFEAKLSDGSKKVASRSEKLAEVEELLITAMEELSSKTGGEDGEEGGGKSAILNLKRAIKGLREEGKEMSMRCGLLQCELISVQKNTVELGRKRQNKKSRSRRNAKGKQQNRTKVNSDEMSEEGD
jgi:hypothetical protein